MKAGDVLGKLLGKLPDVAVAKAPVFVEPPETPDLPDQAQGRPSGPPEETPVGERPDLPEQAADRDPSTGLPLVAMARFPDPFPGEADRFAEEEEVDILS